MLYKSLEIFPNIRVGNIGYDKVTEGVEGLHLILTCAWSMLLTPGSPSVRSPVFTGQYQKALRNGVVLIIEEIT